MTTQTMAHPNIVTNEEWLESRKALLLKEKELTKQQDRLSAERRRLPMVKLEKEYTFDGPEGKVSLLDLFEGRHQLIVYHFMFDPAWDKGCDGCTGYVNALGDLSALQERDTSFVLISRAPLAKLEAYKTLKGWDRPWYSSFGSDFNYDFHVTLDENVAPVEYNYRSKPGDKGEAPGTSVFFRIGDDIFHTYSTFARGGEYLTHTSTLLDITPYGRQEDWEDSPAGWPQRPTYG
ncbi:MAG: DUF899 domain-containing protein [Chloroflexi bacterium]|nr:DUF899 domain-containing protein [Chloroflexota bacterium]